MRTFTVVCVSFVLLFVLGGTLGFILGKRSADRWYVKAICFTGSTSGAPVIDSTGSSPAMIGMPERLVTGTEDTVEATDRGAGVAYNSAHPVKAFLPEPRGDYFSMRVRNENVGAVTLKPMSGTIDGRANLVLREGDECFIWKKGHAAWAATCRNWLIK